MDKKYFKGMDVEANYRAFIKDNNKKFTKTGFSKFKRMTNAYTRAIIKEQVFNDVLRNLNKIVPNRNARDVAELITGSWASKRGSISKTKIVNLNEKFTRFAEKGRIKDLKHLVSKKDRGIIDHNLARIFNNEVPGDNEKFGHLALQSLIPLIEDDNGFPSQQWRDLLILFNNLGRPEGSEIEETLKPYFENRDGYTQENAGYARIPKSKYAKWHS